MWLNQNTRNYNGNYRRGGYRVDFGFGVFGCRFGAGGFRYLVNPLRQVQNPIGPISEPHKHYSSKNTGRRTPLRSLYHNNIQKTKTNNWLSALEQLRVQGYGLKRFKVDE